MSLTVVIPTHNPRPASLARVLEALKAQTLPPACWNLVVVDNASKIDLKTSLDLGWHPDARVVREDRLGLTHARMRGFSEATADIVVLVDDDNELDRDYLERVEEIGQAYPFLGTWSGRITLEFQDPALVPPIEFHSYLTCRDCESDSWSNDRHHHASTPWGAGLCVRRQVFLQYLRQLDDQPERTKLDLQGQSLLYGGDTDIAFVGCEMGLGKGVFTRLHMNHLIPADRCSDEYLIRCVEGHGYSERIHEFALSGTILGMQTGLRGKLGSIRRRMAMNPAERKIDSALERGRRRSFSELRKSAGKQ